MDPRKWIFFFLLLRLWFEFRTFNLEAAADKWGFHTLQLRDTTNKQAAYVAAIYPPRKGKPTHAEASLILLGLCGTLSIHATKLQEKKQIIDV